MSYESSSSGKKEQPEEISLALPGFSRFDVPSGIKLDGEDRIIIPKSEYQGYIQKTVFHSQHAWTHGTLANITDKDAFLIRFFLGFLGRIWLG